MSAIPVGFRTFQYDDPLDLYTGFAEPQPVLSAMNLGASLYSPASRLDLSAIAGGWKIPELRSVIFCTEDAVHERDLEAALSHLAALLPESNISTGCKVATMTTTSQWVQPAISPLEAPCSGWAAMTA